MLSISSLLILFLPSAQATIKTYNGIQSAYFEMKNQLYSSNITNPCHSEYSIVSEENSNLEKSSFGKIHKIANLLNISSIVKVYESAFLDSSTRYRLNNSKSSNLSHFVSLENDFVISSFNNKLISYEVYDQVIKTVSEQSTLHSSGYKYISTPRQLFADQTQIIPNNNQRTQLFQSAAPSAEFSEYNTQDLPTGIPQYENDLLPESMIPPTVPHEIILNYQKSPVVNGFSPISDNVIEVRNGDSTGNSGRIINKVEPNDAVMINNLNNSVTERENIAKAETMQTSQDDPIQHKYEIPFSQIKDDYAFFDVKRDTNSTLSSNPDKSSSSSLREKVSFTSYRPASNSQPRADEIERVDCENGKQQCITVVYNTPIKLESFYDPNLKKISYCGYGEWTPIEKEAYKGYKEVFAALSSGLIPISPILWGIDKTNRETAKSQIHAQIGRSILIRRYSRSITYNIDGNCPDQNGIVVTPYWNNQLWIIGLVALILCVIILICIVQLFILVSRQSNNYGTRGSRVLENSMGGCVPAAPRIFNSSIGVYPKTFGGARSFGDAGLGPEYDSSRNSDISYQVNCVEV